MADNVVQKRPWIERLQDSFKFTILDEEDLREVASYSLSRKGIYLFSISLFVLFSAIIASLIAFTPLKSLVPGYGKIENDKAYVALYNKVENLENKIRAQEVYTIGLQNMLKGLEESSPINEDKEPPEKNVSTPINNRDVKEFAKTETLTQNFFSSPVKGTTSKKYDPDKEHYGVDILASKNATIKAIQDGVIINAGWSEADGNVVYIHHPHNVVSVYKHNSSVLVKTGQRVQTGQAVAIIGNTGELTNGPHLHFELWYDGYPVNPENYITF